MLSVELCPLKNRLETGSLQIKSSYDWHPYKNRETLTETHREEDHVAIEAEIAVIQA